MSTSIYSLSVGTYVPMLKTLSALLDKALAQAGSEAEKLADARLASDMYTLAQQVQQACFYAANDVSRLSGRGPRPFPPVGASFQQLKSEIDETIRFVSSIAKVDFVGAGDRDCSIQISEDMEIKMDGSRYLRSWSLPQFYFHIVTAYDILRSNGIKIGKRDYLNLADAIRPRAA
jgi:uncharacterized protein